MKLFPAVDDGLTAERIAGMVAQFCVYPERVVKRVCDPVYGAPSKFKFLPTLAELKQALEEAAGEVLKEERREELLAQQSTYRPRIEPPRAIEDDEETSCYWGPLEDIQPGDRLNFLRTDEKEAYIRRVTGREHRVYGQGEHIPADAPRFPLRQMTPEQRASRPKYTKQQWKDRVWEKPTPETPASPEPPPPPPETPPEQAFAGAG